VADSIAYTHPGEGMLYSLARSLLFRLDPESAHAMALRTMALVGAVPGLPRALAAALQVPAPEPVEVFGLRFPNRVGLAAGYDKDGEAWRGLAALGFGHIELGTVTPGPQEGNPRPRLFRLVEARSLINRMGFPGQGAAAVAGRLRHPRPPGLVLGVNIGKQRTTALSDAVRDYRELMEVFAPVADYLAVNVSSPNTPGLRRLQEPGFLEGLLGAIASHRDELADRLKKRVPVLVKIAPDLGDSQLGGIVDVIRSAGVDGVIATNTTVEREGLEHRSASEQGGLSGAALTDRSTEVIAAINDHAAGSLPIIGVGGIMTPQDAHAKIAAGATLIQVYTGLVYEGPGLVARILRSLR
jgi:dihydroorotate dehydrogenase